MSQRNTVIRTLHDVGLAAWFGGGLMGAVGLNGAAATAKKPSERLRISAVGWARWTPVQLAAIAVHGVGGIGLILSNKGRLAAQQGAKSNSVVKTVVTAAAGAASVAGGLAGAAILRHADEGGVGVTEPSGDSSEQLQAAQRVEKVTQWAIPVLTGVLLVLNAQQGEQQRPVAGWLEDAKGRAKKVVGR
ncbi:hypothetical protein [Amnibacterium kyonggiense]|uniref:Uncharacterized protein n=1 Tax=Amnibacterium kyonggiense TaxID=595671 RepID=A0A4R7FR37_9MICO|nr:hypothetical protein [Amnibacterium kyonggiense]TDS80272.1 hypothetical protein CLV52_0828 [Amnibacterium kyonggiense]